MNRADCPNTSTLQRFNKNNSTDFFITKSTFKTKIDLGDRKSRICNEFFLTIFLTRSRNRLSQANEPYYNENLSSNGLVTVNSDPVVSKLLNFAKELLIHMYLRFHRKSESSHDIR